MSRYDLLPPNATQLERDFSRVCSSLQRVAPPVPIIRTAKRTDIPASVVPWLIYEYGLGEILPYLGNNQRLALQDGILWQRIRGTPESVHVALSWIGIEGLIEEPEGGTDRWAEYMLGLNAATDGDEIIDRITAISRISSPVRSRLQRIYAVHDFRRAVWDEFLWDDGSIYDDHSGVRPRPDWPQISYGRRYSGLVVWDGAVLAATSISQRVVPMVRLIDTWRYDEDSWDEGWHDLNHRSLQITHRGISAQYVSQNWGPFQWQRKIWRDVNVIVSSALNGIAIDDNTAPAAPVLTVVSSSGQVRVTAETGSTVVVVFSRSGGGTVTRTVTGNEATPVEITLTEAELTVLGSGTINVSAIATDAAGNNSTASTTSFARRSWTPADTATVLWYDASDTTTFDPVNFFEWRNKIGTPPGNSATRLSSGGSSIPTVTANALNGLHTILFDGINDRLETDVSLPAPGPDCISIISVFKVILGGESEDVFIGTRDTFFPAGSFRAISRQGGSSTLGFYGHVNNVPTSPLSLDIGGSYHIFGGWNTSLTGPDNVRLMRDGIVTTHTTSGPLVNHGNLTKFMVGELFSGSAANFSVAEIIVLYSAVTDAIRQRIEGYLAHKWDLAANLPSNHPYKNAPPTT